MYFYCWISTPAKDLSGSRFQSLRSHAPHGRGIAIRWQIDLEDLATSTASQRSSRAMPAFPLPWRSASGPAIATGRIAITSPTFFGTWTSTPAWREPTPWAFIGPINWYGSISNFKLLFDRLVCMNGGNPRPDVIGKKSTVLAQALERSSQWRELSKNHLEGRSAAFFCYGDRGAADLDAAGRPKIHKGWFNPKDEPYDNERNAYQNLILAMSLQWHRGAGLTLELCRDRSWKTVSRYASGQADSLENERRH
jgi:hypothetical protein